MNKFKSASNKKKLSMIIVVAIILNVTLMGTIAYLIDRTEEIVNIFNPGTVTTEVDEKVENDRKSEIKVTNTGNTDAYVRIALVAYRVKTDESGNVVFDANGNPVRIGGAINAPTPETDKNFNLAADWIEHNGHYYYTKPVAPGESVYLLADQSYITLIQFNDADGGVMALDVMASGIQANPKSVVETEWGLTVAEDGTISK